MPSKKEIDVPHSTLKNLRVNFIQQDGLIRAHLSLLEVSKQHLLKYNAGHGDNQLVALEVLQETGENHQK